MYCSPVCRQEWTALKRNESRPPKPPKICVVCGASIGGNPNQRYCSRDCRNVRWRGYNKEKQREHRAEIHRKLQDYEKLMAER